jgi:hypothetical protein
MWCLWVLVDGVGGQMPRFQVHAIAHDDDAVEGPPRLGAVPGDELVDGVLLDSARRRRAEAVKNGGLRVIQVRQAEHSATVILLDSAFAHGDGLHAAGWTYRRTPGLRKTRGHVSDWVLSVIAC